MAGSYTLAEHCRCGAAFLVDGDRHEGWHRMRLDWIGRHLSCLKPDPEPDEDLSDRETGVYSEAPLAMNYGMPEMQIGFARQSALDEV